ncbi:MAG: thioredoxin 1 [Candidatus Azotimanducaceae bacterium]|jgi:thioredoxin 1
MNNYLGLLVFLAASLSFSVTASDKTSSVDALGDISQDQLMSQYQKYQKNYQRFELMAEQLTQMSHWPESLKVEVYFGTWCHDSEREVPRLLKAFASQPQIKLILHALDRNKSEPSGKAKDLNIRYTPTFVIYLLDKEIGRIIERPKKGLIEDISQIIANHQIAH